MFLNSTSVARVAWTDRDEETFGDALRNRRRAAGLTQEELAERSGLSVRTVSGWERGEGAKPRRDTLRLLVRALALSEPDRAVFEGMVGRRSARLSAVEAVPASAPIRESGLARHNVRRSVDSFVGRERDREELAQLLPTAPLVTLLGPGGVGKTRIARELVRREAQHFADGAWLVELADLTDPAMIGHAIATTVGLPDGARAATSVLGDYLRDKRLLLVLDNCEHLIQACAEVVVRLLQGCPHLHVVTTSREQLSINGEMIWLVRPLDIPGVSSGQTVEQIAGSSSVRLFVQRARAVDPEFSVTDANASALARVCVALDGLPLAVELAAPLTRVLSLGQIAERLESDSDILRASSRDASPRQKSVRATIDWSYELLEQQEKVLMRRLAVFAGGWTLDMAEQVCAGEGVETSDILDLLAQLVHKSMIVVDTTRQVARYRLLEPIRQYALEHLESSSEPDDLRARHAYLLLSMPTSGQSPDDFGPSEIALLQRFEAEHANMRAALRWALDHGRIDAALRAAAMLFRFWERRGHLQEGCAWLEEALGHAHAERSPHRGAALNALAFLYSRMGDLQRAWPTALQALTINRERADSLALAFALGNLGAIAYARDEPGYGVAWLQEGVALARRIGYEPMLSLALTFLGRSLVRANGVNDARAPELLREGLAVGEHAQARYATCHALLALGDLECRRDRMYQAMGFWHRALRVQAQLADRRAIVTNIERLAWGLVASGVFDAAVWLFGATQAQRELLGMAMRTDVRVQHERRLDEARTQLGEDFDAAWAVGEASSVEEAVALALEATEAYAVSPDASGSPVASSR